MPTVPGGRVTFAGWVRTRTSPYFIGHRGAGAVIPEHSLPGYVQAIQWAPAIEVSVVRSADGVLFCMHDRTMDRTTTMTGNVADLTAAQIDAARITVPRLGPRWEGDRMPPVPRLEQALKAVAGKAVLCIEAKDVNAFEPMMELIESANMLDAVMIKATIGSSSLTAAQKRGLPLFGYLGSSDDLTQANLDLAGQTLTGSHDALILPTRVSGSLLGDDLLIRAKRACPTVWVYSTHRRSEVDYYRVRGVTGFVSTCSGYTAKTIRAERSPDWTEGIVPGLLTRDPYSDAYAIDWSSVPGALTIGDSGREQYVTLGDLGDVTAQAWRLQIESRVAYPDVGSGDAMVAVVCTADDASPTDQAGTGYRAVWSHDGRIRIEENTERRAVLGSGLAQRPGREVWTHLEVQVTQEAVFFGVGSAGITVRDPRYRGGYIHFGSGRDSGKVTVRSVTLT